jgi:extracellular elastinolytic metalloproteinase
MTRLTFLSALVLIALSATCQAILTAPDAVAHSRGGPRKSLAFGPHHKHRKFISKTYTPVASARAVSKDDIHQSALKLAHVNAGNKEGVSFFVRPDSYEDPTTGLTYIYVKQTINGLQVEDGDMNVVFSSDGEYFAAIY